MSEPRRGVFDEPELEIAMNPKLDVIEARPLASGVLKVKRGEKPLVNKDNVSQNTSEQAQAALERLKDIGRSHGGTSQGTAGGGRQKGGHNYGK